MASSTSPPSESLPRLKSFIPWIVAIAIGLLVLGCSGLLLLGATNIEGSEFAPTHFETRKFELAEFPLVRRQIKPVVHSASTDSTSRYLIANKLIDVPKSKPLRWDLVSIRRLFASSSLADASVLIAYLEGRGGNGIDWEQWSKDHPKAAGVLWPFVQQMAIDNLYLLLPRVFELAENETDPVQLKEDLDAYLINELPGFSIDLFNAHYQQQALTALRSARQRHPNQPSLDKAYDQLKNRLDNDQP